MLLTNSPGTVTTKSRFIFPLRSATCLLLAITVISDSSTEVISSPVTLSFSARVTICRSPLSSVHAICSGTLQAVSVVASLTPGCEMRTRARRCSDPQERSRPESSANGMIRLVVLILPA